MCLKKPLKLFWLVAIIFAIALLAHRYAVDKPRLDAKTMDELTITALPSPPKVKNVTNKDDIEKFATLFNSIETHRTIGETAKGWQIKVDTKGTEKHTILFTGEKLQFDRKWYSVNGNQLDEIYKLYQSFNYPEKGVYDQK